MKSTSEVEDVGLPSYANVSRHEQMAREAASSPVPFLCDWEQKEHSPYGVRLLELWSRRLSQNLC